MTEGPSAKAKQFMIENRRSPVVYASVTGQGGRDATYRLENGLTFTLSAKDCRAAGEPLWPWDFAERQAKAKAA